MAEHIKVEVAGTPVDVRLHDIFSPRFERYYTCYYNKSADLLNGLCDLHGSDKGEVRADGHPYPWPSHSYADFIDRHFGHCRHFIRNVFECGIGTNNPRLASSMGAGGRPGASLRVWRDYFPQAHIHGADVDRDILFAEERISTFHCDQTDPASIAALWRAIPDIAFDLMIDDGLHSFEAGVSLLEHSFARLRQGGIYIIEDVSVASLARFRAWFGTRSYRYDFVLLDRRTPAASDNNLIVLRK